MRPTGVWLWLDHLVLTLLTKSLPAMNITFKSTHTHSDTDTVSHAELRTKYVDTILPEFFHELTLFFCVL